MIYGSPRPSPESKELEPPNPVDGDGESEKIPGGRERLAIVSMEIKMGLRTRYPGLTPPPAFFYFRSSGPYDRQETGSATRSGYFSDRENRSGYFSDREIHVQHKFGSVRQQASIESADSRLCYLTSSEVIIMNSLAIRKFYYFLLYFGGGRGSGGAFS